MPMQRDHVHIPQRIIVATTLEVAGLAICCCGKVAKLANYRAGRWPRREHSEMALALYWELEEYWRNPDAEESEIIAEPGNLLLENDCLRETGTDDDF